MVASATLLTSRCTVETLFPSLWTSVGQGQLLALDSVSLSDFLFSIEGG